MRTFRYFPIFSEDFRRFPKTSDNFRRFKKNSKCWKVILSTWRQISEIFRRFPKTSEKFRRFPTTSEDFIKKIKMLKGRLEHFGTFSKIFKNCRNSSECLFLHSPVLFSKLSKKFPNIQQRRHEPLLPVTDRPLISSCMLLISNHTTFLVQFEINLHS